MPDHPATVVDRSGSHVEQIDALLRPFDRSDAPGLLVGVAREGRFVYRRGVGMASVRHGVANTPATRMRIASVSKQFTSLALLLLAEGGRIDLDAPAESFVPGLPATRGQPTLRHLMTHTAGIRCSLEMASLANGTALQPRTWQQRAMLRQRDAHFAPGEGQRYCNGSYHLLSSVIDRVAGMPFERYMKENVLEALGMHDSAFVPDETTMEPGSAALHVPSPGGGWRSAPVDAEIRGDGGMVSTVDDMLRWLAAVRGEGRRVGSAETWQQLLEPTRLAGGFRSTYAMGVKRTSYRGAAVVHHSGGLFGLNSQAVTVPGFGLDVVVLVNGAAVSAAALGWDLIDAVLGDLLAEPRPSHAGAAEFSHLIGTAYQASDGSVIRFAEVEGRLGIGLQGLAAAPVVRDQGDSLCVVFEDVGLGPIVWRKSDLVASGGRAPARIASTVVGVAEEWRRLDRVIAAGLPPTRRYFSAELAAEATLCRDDMRLALRGDYSGTRRFALEPLGDGVFAAAGIDGADERFVLRLDPGEGFRLDSLRARGMRFAPV